MRVKNLKIGTKLKLAFLSVILLISLSTILALLNIKNAVKSEESLYNGPFVSTTQALGVRRDVLKIDQALANAALEAHLNTVVPEYYKKDISDAYSIVEERILKLKKSLGKKDITKLNEIEDLIIKYKIEADKIIVELYEGDIDKASRAIISADSDYTVLFSSIRDKSIELYDTVEKDGDNFHKEISSNANSSIILSLVIFVISLLLSIIISSRIVKDLRKPIIEIEAAANKLAIGDFDINIEYNSNDELGSLANSMRQLVTTTDEIISDTVLVLDEISAGNFKISPQVEYIGVYEKIALSMFKIISDLSDTMNQINTSSQEVGAASEQVSVGAQMLAQGATEQAGAVEELSATIADISDKIKYTTKNANTANEISLDAGREVENGSRQMAQMVNAMEDISSSSNEIRRIIKTIDDIAFQTNILALNAAVEAARAGNAGKGFAVVADEVRNLASKSAEAAKNTSDLIEKSIQTVNIGSEIANNTALSLQRIIQASSKALNLIDEIAKASEEQSEAITQVTLGIDQIVDVVQTNSATAEESAAASEELNAQAQMLKSLIEKFKLAEK